MISNITIYTSKTAILNALSFWLGICILDFYWLFATPFYLLSYLALLLPWPRRKLSKLNTYLWEKVDRYSKLKVVPQSFFGNLSFLKPKRKRRPANED